MENQVLENKKIINNIINLSSNIIKVDFDNVLIDDYILVDETLEMRLDSLAFGVYGTEDDVWIIMKFNGISNPFGVKKGEVLAIPNIQSFLDNIKLVNFSDRLLVQEPFIKKLTREDLINAKSNSTSNSKQLTGSTEKIKKTPDGRIIF